MIAAITPQGPGVTASQECRCLDRLTYHASRLDALLQLLANPVCLVGPPVERGYKTIDLYGAIRAELRRDYDAGDGPKLSRVQLLTQHALYGAFTELRAGSGPQAQMVRLVQRARRVIAGTLTELRDANTAPRPVVHQ